jgi:hypothetical protein
MTRWPDHPILDDPILEILLFLRCVEQWLTMCKLVVIIKQFREFESLEELRARLEVRLGTPSLKHPAKTFAPGRMS